GTGALQLIGIVGGIGLCDHLAVAGFEGFGVGLALAFQFGLASGLGGQAVGNGLLAQPLGLLLGRATGGLVGFTGSRLTSRQFGINGGNAVLRMALLLLHGQRLGIKVAGLGQAVLRVVRISRRDQVLIALLAVLPFALEPLTLGLGLGLGIEQAFDLLDAGLGMR